MNTIDINVEALVPSKTNRKFFDQSALDELAANVAEMGVLQPLLVRLLEADRYEIVFGERRWRAACAAGLETVRCDVRVLSDREALELQLVENLQREDPDVIEEATALQAMLDLREGDVRCYSISALAAKLGKSRHFVQDRLPLVNLTRPMADALRSGKLSPKTAALIGRLPEAAARNEVFGAVRKLDLSFAAAQDLIRREYQLTLKGATFDRDDAELMPKAGACGDCPKRLGNIDSEAKDGQVCCDPGCFRAKCEARWLVVTDEARARGEVVLSDEDSRIQFGDDGKHLSFNSSYVLWEQRPPEDILKPEIDWREVESWKDLVGNAVEPVLARVPATGRSVYMAKLDLCLTAAVQAGEGDIFKDATLRAYSALSPKGASLVPFDNHAAADSGADEDGADERSDNAGESVPVLDKSAQSQKDAREALAELRGRVAELTQDEAILCEPQQCPALVWQLLIQSAAMNVGASGRKLVESWFELDESVWADEILSGKLDGFASFAYPVLLQAMLCCEWDPAHQEKFLGELLEYVSPVVEDDEEGGAAANQQADISEAEVPEGYRPAAQNLPDMETPCDVVCLDGSKHVACLAPVDFEDGKGEVEAWLDNDSGAVLPSAVVGWEYWEESEGGES